VAVVALVVLLVLYLVVLVVVVPTQPQSSAVLLVLLAKVIEVETTTQLRVVRVRPVVELPLKAQTLRLPLRMDKPIALLVLQLHTLRVATEILLELVAELITVGVAEADLWKQPRAKMVVLVL
jgi:hypothetical protein